MISSQFPKVCSCCQKSLSESDWSTLPLVGEMKDDVERLELRNCVCGTTLAALTHVYRVENEENEGVR